MKIIRDVASNLTVDSQRELKFPYYEKIKIAFMWMINIVNLFFLENGILKI